jgi:flagellar biosynthesis chaperone FliJ
MKLPFLDREKIQNTFEAFIQTELKGYIKCPTMKDLNKLSKELEDRLKETINLMEIYNNTYKPLITILGYYDEYVDISAKLDLLINEHHLLKSLISKLEPMIDEYGNKLAPYHKKPELIKLCKELLDFAKQLANIYKNVKEFLTLDHFVHERKPLAAVEIANMFLPSSREDILRDRDRINQLYNNGQLLEPMSFLKCSKNFLLE